MKKIGIITFHRSINYGAFLQCYALQNKLNELGHSASVIDFENPSDKKKYSLVSHRSLKSFLGSLIILPINAKRKHNFKKALQELSLSNPNEKFDLAIAGSDQIWNPELTGGSPESYFFLQNISAKRKISYAASIGNEKAIEPYRSTLKKYLNDLNSISVREQQAKTALTPLTKKPITVTIDPTLLLDQKTWLKKIEKIPPLKKDYIFSYFIGNTKKSQIKSLNIVSEKLGLKVLSFSKIPHEKHLIKYCYTDSPLAFLAKLRDAKLVLTSSFHGTVFSIIFHKNFYVLLPNPKRRSRLDNLLKSLGLENRIIESESDLKKITLADIDYTEPDKKLATLRKGSLNWLKTAIGD